MSPCECLSDDLTAVTFGRGLALLRCSLHEQQTWVADGEPIPLSQALPVLRVLFGEERGAQAVRPARGRTRLSSARLTSVRTHRPARRERVLGGAVDDESLTALLNARGLQGSWAVA